MVTWRGKTADKLNRTELEYALQDAVEALTLHRRTVSEDSLFRGLMIGFVAGGLLAGLAFAVIGTL